MRKSWKKYVTLNCNFCHKEFSREAKFYNHDVKLGQKNFYCNLDCRAESQRDEFSNFRPILNECKKTSKQRVRDFNLTLEYLKELWEKQNGICSYTNIKMLLHKSGDKHCLNSASLDRIDSSKGYIKGNVEYVCLFINYAKNGFTKDEVKEFLQRIVT